MIYLGDQPVGICEVYDTQEIIDTLARTAVSVNNSRITSLGYMAFSSCTELVSVSLPNLVSVTGSHIFNNCNKLSSVYFPKLEGTVTQLLTSSSLTTLALPMVNGLANSAVMCSNLQAIDLGRTDGNGGISAGNFNGDTALTVIVLRRNSVVDLQRLNEIEGTPFGANGSGGTLYVPSALKTAYESATNWSTLLAYPNNNIEAIEGSIYEDQYVDGTPVIQEVTS